MRSEPFDIEAALSEQFGRIDIYVFDQLMRGRLTSDMCILDAGCGGGRNAHYLLRNGCSVHGVDANAEAIQHIRSLAEALAPGTPLDRFVVADLDDLPHGDGTFDAVLCSAVLHFASDEDHFERMMREMWRVLLPGGVFFARLASSIGIEAHLASSSAEARRQRLPDGSERFLVDEEYLAGVADRLEAELIDPLKTTNVHNLRAMTTWVLRKPGGAD